MVPESLTLTFNLLTVFYSSLAYGLVTSFCRNWSVSESELSGFCVFLEDHSTDMREIFFPEVRRKHLIITTCVEKQCTPSPFKF